MAVSREDFKREQERRMKAEADLADARRALGAVNQRKVTPDTRASEEVTALRTSLASVRMRLERTKTQAENEKVTAAHWLDGEIAATKLPLQKEIKSLRGANRDLVALLAQRETDLANTKAELAKMTQAQGAQVQHLERRAKAAEEQLVDAKAALSKQADQHAKTVADLPTNAALQEAQSEAAAAKARVAELSKRPTQDQLDAAIARAERARDELAKRPDVVEMAALHADNDRLQREVQAMAGPDE